MTIQRVGYKQGFSVISAIPRPTTAIGNATSAMREIGDFATGASIKGNAAPTLFYRYVASLLHPQMHLALPSLN